jgi:K+-transporting ATPase ATPase A chain
MTANGLLQIALFFGVLMVCVKPLGAYMAHVFRGEHTMLSPVFRPIERSFYKIFGVDEEDDMKWTTYAFALLLFSLVGLVLTYVLLRLQGALPWNPQGFGTKEMTPDLAFNTAASFTTNTNWQSYVPETTLSYFSNMVALTIHNWMSAAAGLAVAIALARGLARRQEGQSSTTTQLASTASSNDETARKVVGIGNFWVDVTRSILYILLPMCLVYALVLVWQGVPQNFSPYTQATTLEGAKQTIAQGPVASQEAIKMLGTNGGGFFNANSSHPYENPTPLTNFLQMLSIFLIPAALTYTFGKMVGNIRQGWALLAAMSLLFFAGVFTSYHFEQAGNPQVAAQGIQTQASSTQSGGNMEGKETRFGIVNSALFATVTTDASCGAVNAMHDSFTPIGGMVPMLNILSGEVIFGGVGAGLYGMLMFAILAVFIAGLMVGRTPEYLGKKIEQYEVKMAMLAVLVLAASILGFAAVGANLNLDAHSAANYYAAGDTHYDATYNNVNNSGPHGFSEILYAYTSATGNNGSAFAGITANTPFYNVTLGIAMLIGRFLMIIPLLAIAGSMARKKIAPVSAGTFPTDSSTFVGVLIGVIIIVGALTYFPALALGPIVEHFQMLKGRVF